MKNVQKLFFLLGIISLAFLSCEDDEGGTIKVSKDGAYVSGAAVGGVDVKLSDALVEGSGFSAYAREGLYEIYFYCVPGALEFKLIEEDVATVYGPNGTPTTVTLDGTDADQITGTFWTGTLIANNTPFNITDAGFYHLTFDETSKAFWVVPVTKWEWVYNDTELDLQPGGNAEEVVWLKTGVKFPTHASKFRYNDGWKILTDIPVLPENADLSDNDNIILFTNFGNNDDGFLSPGGGNIDVTKGMYDITLTWTPATGFVADINKTGDVENTDYSDYLMGFIGNAVIEADTSWGWGATSYKNLFPTKDGEIYTWQWEGVKIADTTGGRTWKFREGNAWDTQVAYTDVSMSGSAASDFFSASGDGNFGVKTTKVYDFVLTVNAEDDSWTLAAAEQGGATFDQWGLIGSATPDGWDADTDMTPNENGTEWTWTGDLVEGEIKFRANNAWDQQIGDNGSGGAEFSSNATSWVIGAAEVGNYTIVLDSETPAVTFTKN